VSPRGRVVPRTAVAAAAAGAALFVLPLAGLLARTPWRTLPAVLATPEALGALRLSVLCSLAATAVAIVAGLPLAWVQARGRFRGRALLRAVTMLPVVLPPVVGGAALLAAFGRHGLLGRWLDATLGVRLPFTPAGTVLAEAFVATPFFVLTVEAALRAVDGRLEDAARTLGAGPWTVFRRITIPLAAPSIAAGALVAWARALGEFGATITFAGNVPGRTQTLPLAVYLMLHDDADAAVAVSMLLLAVSVTVLVLLRGRWLAPGRAGT
jgi:molybdate transport system permease protein